MAEFLNTPRDPARLRALEGDSGFAAFGKPVSLERRTEALKHLREMGVVNNEAAWECIGKMSEAIARDEPYEAMRVGMLVIDLTGTYRLMAVLCTDKGETNGATAFSDKTKKRARSTKRNQKSITSHR